MEKKLRLVSGMRPTGKLHIGHYVGALENWITLQENYESFFLIADYHVLTTTLNTEHIYENSIQMLIDWLSSGIDPNKSIIFRQSQIKEHTELFLIYSMLITKSRLERNPTLKDQIRDLNIENVIYGHLGYPVLQASDILLYKGEVVPVGEDQVPHIEITREVARDFNRNFEEIFPIPNPKLTIFSRLSGLDGNTKMSKSLNNTISISASEEEIKTQVKKSVTDPKKIRKNDIGHPEVCVVFTYHKKFNSQEIEQIEKDCKSGNLGCVDCKNNCAKKISNYFENVREKRNYYENNFSLLEDILNDGEKKAKKIASQTMSEVRSVMKFG